MLMVGARFLPFDVPGLVWATLAVALIGGVAMLFRSTP